MAATVGTSGSGSPDMALVSELLEEISRHPPAVEARKLLVEHYISIGWLDAANENAKQLKKDAPRDPEVRSFLAILEKKPELPAAQPTSSTTTVASTPTRPNFSAPTSVFSGLKTSKRKNPQPTIQLPENLDETRQELTQGYRALRERAKYLLTDFLHLQALQKQADLPQSKKTHRIKAIAEQNTSTQTHRPVFVRSRARDIQARPSEALEIIILDLENTLEWSREADRADDDKARDVLVQRVRALESALPEDLKLHCELGLMHVEHENLERNYVNDETMLGDPVKEIPRANFYVTEDNYAWDLEELAQAISANGGIMRNPLSKDMFTPKDVRGILMHVHGERLRALQVEQHEMSKGVRLETIQQMELLSGILLEDQTSDALPSRRAVDEFMAYIATLPESEQKAINGLKCPAKDSHTGQAYDFTIGEAVQDAKGNKVCFHKTGDFIKQAAEYLARNNSKSPNADKCIVM